MFVSVVIPHFNDSARLKRCLEALSVQEVNGLSFEVIVVENGTEALESLPEFPHLNLRIVHEATPGSYHARNTGVLASRGAVIAFTDADCAPDVHWLARGVAGLSAHGANAIIGGKILLFFENNRSRTQASIVELYEELFAFTREHFVFAKPAFQTANLFVWREMFETVGMFNASLKSAGDFEWCWRAGTVGYKLHYAENSIVFHPARRTFGELFRKSRRVAGGGFSLEQSGIVKPRKRLLGELGGYIKAIGAVLFSRSPMSAWQKIGVLFVAGAVKTTKLLERLRLRYFGGEVLR